MDTAMAAASRPHDFKLLVQGEGKVGTSMDDVVQSDEAEAVPVAEPSRDPANLIPGL
jgi:hypothetical protein